ncbi:MAG: PD-(D/E)XK nuclease family protein, partial [Clostridia bacterium]|nr:PD-(D/E)XK nuclease family protein [Clostridia bacterium]
MITLSYSKVKTWRTCRRLYRFLYVERLPTPPRPALFVGEVVHRTLQAYLSYPPLERLRLDLGQLLRQLWRAAGTQRRRLTFGTAEEEARRGRQALAMLERFYRSRHAAAQPAALERWLEVPLAAEVVVNGRADRIDEESGVLQVVDYKTGWVPRGEEPNITLQAAFYTFLASAATGRPVGGVTFFYL